MRRRALAALLLSAGALVALVSPLLRSRNEVRWAKVEVKAVPVAVPHLAHFRVHVTNTHPRRMRIWVRAVDLPAAPFAGAEVVGGEPPGPPERLPVAGALRFPARREIGVGETFEIPFQVKGMPPGRFQGELDVILDDTTWTRVPFAIEVRGPTRGDPSEPY